MDIAEAFEILRVNYGSHSAAAKALAFNVSYYRDIRNGRAKLSERTAQFVILKAQEIQGNFSLTASPTTPPEGAQPA